MALFLLDADTVSAALRGRGNAAREIARRRPSELALSAITLAGLRFGAERSGSKKVRAAIDAFVNALQIFPFDSAAAARFGKLAASLADRQAPLGQMDALLASHALSLSATLVAGHKHFSQVRGLTVVNWI